MIKRTMSFIGNIFLGSMRRFFTVWQFYTSFQSYTSTYLRFAIAKFAKINNLFRRF